MKRGLTWPALLSVALATVGFYHAKTARATPPNLFKGTTIAVGTFNEFDVFNQFRTTISPQAFLATSGYPCKRPRPIRPVCAKQYLAAGGSSGWHTHPGHSLIIITSGTVTEYEDDCTPHVYAFVPGQPAPTLVDPGSGHGHVHIIRNEGTVPATSIAVQLVPYDPSKLNRRIDEPAPEACSNIK